MNTLIILIELYFRKIVSAPSNSDLTRGLDHEAKVNNN